MQRSVVNGVKASAAAAATAEEAATTPPLRRAAAATTTTTTPEADPLNPETPVPDYEEEASGSAGRRKSLTFVNNFQNIIFNIRSIEELYTCFPEPDPDYVNDEEDNGSIHVESDLPPPPALTAEELSEAVSEAYDLHVSNGVSMTSDDTAPSSSKDPPLIKPKPLHNPCLDSKERQALHRELLMNYRIGKDVLQKPELNKVLRERREKEKKKEWEDLKSTRERTSLVMKLEERANKLKEGEEKKTKVTTEESQAPELTRMHRRIMQKSSSSSEQT